MDWVKKICLLLCGLAFLWILFAPQTGVVSLLRQKSELKALKAETEELRLQNEALRAEIEKLREDPAYLEEVARRDYGLLKENERVYDFAKPDDKKQKE